MAEYRIVKEGKKCFYVVKKTLFFSWVEVGEDYFGSCFRYEFKSKKKARKAIRKLENKK